MSKSASVAACGTYAAYQQHRKRGEKPCDVCREACNLYLRDYRASSPERNKKFKYWTRTRDQALERLAAEHPERFQEILREVRSESPKGDSLRSGHNPA